MRFAVSILALLILGASFKAESIDLMSYEGLADKSIYVDKPDQTNSSDPEIQSWVRQGFKISEIFNVAQTPWSQAQVRIPVTAFLQETTVWTQMDAWTRLERTRNYYRKCGVDLFPIKLVKGYKPGWEVVEDSPRGFVGSFNPQGQMGVFVVFIDRFKDDPNNPYASGLTGSSGPRYWVKHVFAENVIFLAAATLGFERYMDPTYDILSHEFAHILLNAPHNKLNGNVLSANYDGMKIEQEQCSQIRSNWIDLR